MPRVITLRLQNKEYEQILEAADNENRPISNFITTYILQMIKASYFVDAFEMDHIRSDKKLLAQITAGHRDARKMKGKFVG